MPKKARRGDNGVWLVDEEMSFEQFRRAYSRDFQPTLAGDVVEKFCKYTGIAAAAKAYERLSGRSCGCKKRKNKLNRAHARLKRYLSGDEKKESSQ